VVKICCAIRITLNQLVSENVCIITILLRKWYHNISHLAELAPQNCGKTAGIDMIWRNYDYDIVILFVLYVLWQQIVDEDWKKTSSTLIAQQQQLQPTFLNYTKLHQYILLKSSSHHLLTATFFKPRLHDTTGCQTSLTTCCIVYNNRLYRVYSRLSNRVEQQTTRLTTGCIV